MKKNTLFITLVCICLLLQNFKNVFAQGVVPVQHYTTPKLLGHVSVATSFAYSLRKVKDTWTGFALKIRLGTSNAEADVAFDNTGIVSATSNVTVTAVGTSGLSNGQVLQYSTFVGAQTVFVKTWYDQGGKAYHATQNTAASQPTLTLNSAGGSNTKPSIVFTGTQFLDVGQTLQTVTTNGINATFLIWTKVGGNSSNDAFGYWQSGTPPIFRWSMHFNWTDGKCYFDAGEVCCAANRSFTNSSNVGVYNQYSFVRGTSYKTVNVGGATTTLNNSSAASTSSTGSSFYIGKTVNGTDAGYSGNVCEIIMFPTDLATAALSPLEANQIKFWSN